MENWEAAVRENHNDGHGSPEREVRLVRRSGARARERGDSTIRTVGRT